MWTKRALRAGATLAFVAGLVDVASASFLPGPFTFRFFTPALTELFLLPFQILGCA